MIELKNVCVSFGETKVLDGLNLSFPDTGVFSIAAPSGAGKTTLLRVLSGLQKPQSGTVSGLEGKRLSVVFQEDRLLPTKTAVKNVSVVSDEKTAEGLLGDLGFSREDLHKKPSALSGGMKRRVALARALAAGGEVLIMDEPFKGLDGELKSRIIPVVLSRGFELIIFTSHDPSESDMMGAAAVNSSRWKSANE